MFRLVDEICGKAQHLLTAPTTGDMRARIEDHMKYLWRAQGALCISAIFHIPFPMYPGDVPDVSWRYSYMIRD
mgnify:CR=1 FL=1